MWCRREAFPDVFRYSAAFFEVFSYNSRVTAYPLGFLPFFVSFHGSLKLNFRNMGWLPRSEYEKMKVVRKGDGSNGAKDRVEDVSPKHIYFNYSVFEYFVFSTLFQR